MNVLILTPDAVGSTLLQRMLTVYMQFHTFAKPVINLHELTNGLAKYFSPEFNRELIGKKTVQQWGYHQSLAEVVELLDSVDHYKTSRLAHYHIIRRGDSLAEQVEFYRYLNDNFYVIACQRNNVFEHALSTAIAKITKKLNVYTAYEKIKTFYDIHHSGIEVDTQVFLNALFAYRSYMQWSHRYFDISKYFYYELDIPRLESFVLDLPVFVNQSEKITWQQNFGIDFNQWNKMHYAMSDLNLLENNTATFNQLVSMDSGKTLVLSPSSLARAPRLKQSNHQIMMHYMHADKQAQYQQHLSQYMLAQNTIEKMVNLGIMISGPPIKKQTLAEKKKVVRNFDQLVGIYNEWAQLDTVAQPLTDQYIVDNIQTENKFWHDLASDANLSITQ